MTKTRVPRLFTIQPGAPFLSTFVDALLAGKIVPDFPASDDPLALSTATIFTPTRRSAAALAREFASVLRKPVALLPHIIPLGHLEEIETSLAFGEPDLSNSVTDLPDAISESERRLVLSRLIFDWARKLQHAIVEFSPDGRPILDETQPLLVARSAGHAWRLSGDLAALIDDMIIERVEWTALNRLVPEPYDKFWNITLDFLKIAIDLWPKHLSERGLIDAAERQSRLVDAEIARLANHLERAPIIAIGSTGAVPATARLLGAIARHANGAVVLPGLDKHLDELAWAMIPGDVALAIEAADGHPQAVLHRMLRSVGSMRSEVAEFPALSPALRARARFVSAAMRPAEATAEWLDFALAEKATFSDALAGVTLVEAGDEREEALCLAIAARRALECENYSIAIVTPDRALARRVAGELARWEISVDDSGGQSLALTSAGALARLTLAAARGGVVDALALLSHARVNIGYESAEFARLRDLIEIGVWRAIPTTNVDNETILLLARQAASGRDAHPAAAAITADDWIAIGDFLRRLDAALQPLRSIAKGAALASWVVAHRESLGRLSGSDEGEDAVAITAAFESLSIGPIFNLDASDYGALFDAFIAEAIVRTPKRAHPRLAILGPLEARLLHADVMLLGGLDEAIWPPAARNDSFLNRPMRAALGLGPPERRIGQTAHDFVQFLGAPEVIISRAKKRDGSPTTPSRFLQRFAALAGPEIWSECLARGEEIIALADAIDAAPARLSKRPNPRPPVELRPRSLSVTRIEALRRDPYGIYAERILGLAPLSPLGVEPGARETGNLLHEIIATFTNAYPAGALPGDALKRIHDLARESFSSRFDDPDFRLFLWSRIEIGLARYVDWELRRRGQIKEILVEQTGKHVFSLVDNSIFTLTAIADRIERRKDGNLVIVDFKSGKAPSKAQVASGFSPQLTLEAAIIEAGGFENIGKATVVDAEYVRLIGDGSDQSKALGTKEQPFPALTVEHFKELRTLLDQFRDPRTPYPPRPYPQFINAYSDFDHLARVKEWLTGEDGGEA